MASLPPARKILLLAANPKGASPLRLDEEVREIDAGLRRSQHRDQFDLAQKWAVRPRDIQRAMLDVNPQIVHFSGHGIGAQPLAQKGDGVEDIGQLPAAGLQEAELQAEGLVFEDEVGQAKLVSGAALAGLFRLFAEQVECVVLNRCYSQPQAQAIAAHIPYVIGMSQAIGDRAAIEFAVGFYDALGAGRSVEFAYELGCSAMQLAGMDESAIPVLIKQSGADETFTPISPAISPSLVEENSQSQSTGQPPEVFFSYAHEDEGLRDQLAKHLKLLQRQGVISAWHDRQIDAGDEWRLEIEQRLNHADVILLLISADFLASDFCWGVELARAMQRHEAREARVIPIILREVDWQGAPFGKLQALPKNAEPVTNWSNQDQAFADVARGIRRAVESIKVKSIKK